MAFQAFNLSRWVRGSILVGEPDAIPEDALRRAVNVRLDRTAGVIEVRPGWVRRTGVALANGIVYLTRLFGHAGTWSFAHTADGILRVLESNWAEAQVGITAGTDTISSVSSPDGHGSIWGVFVNRLIAVKHRGFGNWQQLGVPPPGAEPLTSFLAPDITTLIDDMKDANSWTGTNLVGNPTNDPLSYQVPPSSIQFLISPSTFGSIYKWHPGINLETLPIPADHLVRNDDYITLWIRTFNPTNIAFVQIDIDVDNSPFPGDTAFTKNFYSVRIGPTRLNTTSGGWTHLQIRKSEFSRSGDDPAKGWALSQVWRIGVQTGAGAEGVLVNVDTMALRGGFGVEGTISYTVTYRNSVTMGRGNPPKLADFSLRSTIPLFTNRQSITLDISNVVAGGLHATADPQVDRIMIWRRGGTFSSFVLVAEIPYASPGTWTDLYSDEVLVLTNQMLELDNDMPPVDTTGSPRVIFGPNATGHYFMIVDDFKLYFSKPYETLESRIDNWPRLNFANIGDGSTPAIAGTCEGQQTTVWTNTNTFNVVGISAETFVPYAIDGSRGIVGPYAFAVGEGALFFVSQDGIYMQQGLAQQKITGAIDPFFQGRTIDGQVGINTDPAFLAGVRLAFLHEPTGPMLVMSYTPAGQTAGLLAHLVVKPHIQTGALTECFFDYSLRSNITSLYFDAPAKQLLAGTGSGHIFRIEDPSATTDDNAAIPYQARTVSHTCGGPTRSKYVTHAVFEGNTTGQFINVTAIYDRNGASVPLGGFGTDTETAILQLPSTTPRILRRDVALDVAGTAVARLAVIRLGVLAESQPEYTLFFESGDVSFEFVTQLKTLIIDSSTATNLTLIVIIDQVEAYRGVFFATVGRQVTRYPLPPGLRGRVFRVVMQSTGFPMFLPYRVVGLVKQLGIERDYTEHNFMSGT